MKIKNLNDLEAFLLKNDVSIETKYNVWTEALNQYSFHVIEVKYNENCKEIENGAAILPQMLKAIDQIRNDKPIIGFWVMFK